MRITYANARVEKYFTDFNKMQRKLPYEWVRTIKKHLDHLRAAENFGVFLSLGLGKPERLRGSADRYSLRVSANARLIIEVSADQMAAQLCEVVEIEGVTDYHGDKENWYIP